MSDHVDALPQFRSHGTGFRRPANIRAFGFQFVYETEV